MNARRIRQIALTATVGLLAPLTSNGFAQVSSEPTTPEARIEALVAGEAACTVDIGPTVEWRKEVAADPASHVAPLSARLLVPRVGDQRIDPRLLERTSRAISLLPLLGSAGEPLARARYQEVTRMADEARRRLGDLEAQPTATPAARSAKLMIWSDYVVLQRHLIRALRELKSTAAVTDLLARLDDEDYSVQVVSLDYLTSVAPADPRVAARLNQIRQSGKSALKNDAALSNAMAKLTPTGKP